MEKLTRSKSVESRRHSPARALPGRDAGARPPLRPEPATLRTLIATLSAYMSRSGDASTCRHEVVEKTKQAILDTLAAMISGSELPPGNSPFNSRGLIRAIRSRPVAASNVMCGPIEAALANGMLAHSDETDDSHSFSQSHPGCSVVPAALAVGEHFSIDGQRFMRAVALGYDIGTRVTITLGRLPYMAETHRSTHALCGTFGSAAAAACAADLNAQQMRWLLSYTGAAGFRPRFLAARHRPYRESFRLCGHAGAQWRDLCTARSGRRQPASTMCFPAPTISFKRSFPKMMPPW